MKVKNIPEIEIEGWYLEETLEGQFILQVKTSPINKSFNDDKRELTFGNHLRHHNVYVSGGCLYTHPLDQTDVIDAARTIIDAISEHNQWVRSENRKRKHIRTEVYTNIGDFLGTGKEVSKEIV